MKRQWRVLQLPPEYTMDVQAHIPVALSALHNFIRRHDPDIYDAAGEYGEDLLSHELNFDSEGAEGELGDGPADGPERRRADQRRDAIANAMWNDYVAVRAARGNPIQ
jgi:hypothetical protein